MNTFEVTFSAVVFADTVEEAEDIITEILEGDAVVDSWHIVRQPAVETAVGV
jgi:hypothetical protein